MQLLRRDRSEWWSRAEVLRKLHDIDPDAVRGSLAHLQRLGLLDRDRERFKASDGLPVHRRHPRPHLHMRGDHAAYTAERSRLLLAFG